MPSDELEKLRKKVRRLEIQAAKVPALREAATAWRAQVSLLSQNVSELRLRRDSVDADRCKTYSAMNKALDLCDVEFKARARGTVWTLQKYQELIVKIAVVLRRR